MQAARWYKHTRSAHRQGLLKCYLTHIAANHFTTSCGWWTQTKAGPCCQVGALKLAPQAGFRVGPRQGTLDPWFFLFQRGRLNCSLSGCYQGAKSNKNVPPGSHLNARFHSQYMSTLNIKRWKRQTVECFLNIFNRKLLHSNISIGFYWFVFMDLTLAFFLKSETYSFIPEPVLFCLWKYSHQKSVVIHYYSIDFKVLVQLKLNGQLFVFSTPLQRGLGG